MNQTLNMASLKEQKKSWTIHDIDGTILGWKISFVEAARKYGSCEVTSGYTEYDTVNVWIDSWGRS